MSYLLQSRLCELNWTSRRDDGSWHRQVQICVLQEFVKTTYVCLLKSAEAKVAIDQNDTSTEKTRERTGAPEKVREEVSANFRSWIAHYKRNGPPWNKSVISFDSCTVLGFEQQFYCSVLSRRNSLGKVVRRSRSGGWPVSLETLST